LVSLVAFQEKKPESEKEEREREKEKRERERERRRVHGLRRGGRDQRWREIVIQGANTKKQQPMVDRRDRWPRANLS